MIRAVIFEERAGDHKAVLIQCLERDICAQATTIQDAIARVAMLIAVEYDMRGGDLGSLAAAPNRFFTWFDEIVNRGVVKAKALGVAYFEEPLKRARFRAKQRANA
jgi:hypothetical protein